ncbi:MAG TPA: hypothetical protein P5555_06570 [Candidatus Paceibacterota bacterium]|nr:hypothetical protein [Verrucomicrobiota bacterium]HRZ44837.1 hypothetical protein [Candidatus Paceibacterota bacterium]
MKKMMIPWIFGAVLCSSLAVRAANIAWVSLHPADNTPSAAAATAGFTQAPDVGYTALLAANGHTVTRFVTIGELGNSPDMVAALNTNDLVIISRSVPSGHYDSATERAAWHGITAPLMTVGAYINRNNRLGFHTGDTIPSNNSSQMRLKVNTPFHPIFAGIALNTTNLMINPYSMRVTFTNATTGTNILQGGISVVTSPVIAGGTILATVGTAGDAAFGGMVIGEFPAGTAGSKGEVMAAKRMVFLTGSAEAGITSEGVGIFDLLPDGQTLFLNAVRYMTTPQGPVCTTPLVGAANLFPGDSWTFNANVIGDPPMTYQWYKDDAPIAAGTSAALALSNLGTPDAGDYFLIANNSAGSATSTVARLEFAAPPAANLTNGIISYWPLDDVIGPRTVDMVSGYDMNLYNMGATNIVPGRWGNAFQFEGLAETMLTRTHNPGDDLPIVQHPNFTVSLWVQGLAPQTDRRVFSETAVSATQPLWDLGTHLNGTDDKVDIYIRTDSNTVFTDHRHSTNVAYDGAWHHLAYVQRDVGNGNMKAQLWIDGVLDPVAIIPGRPISAKVTTIGGVFRISPAAAYTGLIDEVATWNRALSPEEIAMLQTTTITNPPSRIQPLAINSFKADLPAVVSGGTTVLRWDVSKDVNQVILDPIGDVTSLTSAGIGSRTVTNTAPVNYLLTVHRRTDTMSATTSVAVVEGVAPGWTLLDNFDTCVPGSLYANGYWNDASGVGAQVVDLDGNPAVRTSTGNAVAYLNLRDLKVLENQACTLFFRMIPGTNNIMGITNIVGLTDKNQRGYADGITNIGSVLYIAPITNDFFLVTNGWYMGARNGYPGMPIEFVHPALDPATVYNVWIDITNAPVANYFMSDTFSVYVQKDGDTEGGRILLFQDYVSDRDLFLIDDVLGGIQPNLDKLILLGNNATYSAWFDDFYLSRGGYNATVPRPYGFSGQLPATMSIQFLDGKIEIQWTKGVLQQAPVVTGPWDNVPENPASPYTVTPSEAAMFYRTRQ